MSKKEEKTVNDGVAACPRCKTGERVKVEFGRYPGSDLCLARLSCHGCGLGAKPDHNIQTAIDNWNRIAGGEG